MSTILKKNGPFDVKTVESLVALMTEHDLSEIYLRDGNQHLRLRRGAAPTASPIALSHAPVLPAAPVPSAPKPAEAAPEAAALKKNLLEIKSETVGIFYAQAKPGDPPYVKVGDRITPTTPVGMIVVMKTNNEIQANCTGTVVEVLVQNEQSVDFGQTLFRVDPGA